MSDLEPAVVIAIVIGVVVVVLAILITGRKVTGHVGRMFSFEFSPNGGGSTRDAIDRIEAQGREHGVVLKALDKRMGVVEKKLGDE